MKKISQKYFGLTILFLLMPYFLRAQLIGYNSSIGTTTVNSGEIMTICNTASSVSSISTSLGISTLTVGSSSGFAIGNKVLIIQMDGANVGTHEGLTVSSVPSSTSITCNALLNSYSGTIQIIKVELLGNVTVSGILTCPAWNGSTGGILVGMFNSLTFSGQGKIVVSGKGYFTNPSDFGTGGTGGLGSTSPGAGGSGAGANGGNGFGSPACNTHFLCGDGSHIAQLNAGFNGGAGGSSGSAGNSGSANSFSIVSYAGPNLNTKIVMGSAGYAPSGYGGGTGGYGGGAGGAGGASVINNGSSGANGGNGEAGGNAGIGGKGGGIIYLKLNSLTASGTRFYAEGEAGDPGKHGGNGGVGGLGGSGGIGICDATNKYHSGGTGGSGFPGIGADGGDGSYGGYPGTIWVVTSGTNPLTSGNVSVNAGATGPGGYAGFGNYTYTCDYSPLIDLSNCNLNILPCTPPPTTSYHVCDCQTAFQQVETATAVSDNGSGLITFTNSTGNAYYDYSNYAHLYAVKTVLGITTTYHCNLGSKTDCDNIFQKVASTDVDAGDNSLDQLTVGGTGNNFSYWNSQSTPTYEYIRYVEDNYIVELHSKEGEKKCFLTSCNPYDPNSDPADVVAFRGNDGNTPSGQGAPSNGTIGTSNSSNCPIPSGSNLSGWKKEKTDANDLFFDQLGITFKPNPVISDLEIELKSEVKSEYKITILDITGKQIWKSTYQATHGQNKFHIDMKSQNSGVYILHITDGTKTSLIKFVKE